MDQRFTMEVFCGVIWLACWAYVWPNVPQIANADTNRPQADTKWDTLKDIIHADPYGYTFRYKLRFVQIRTGISADTNRDTCRYRETMYCNNVQIRKNIRIGVRTSMYAKIRT